MHLTNKRYIFCFALLDICAESYPEALGSMKSVAVQCNLGNHDRHAYRSIAAKLVAFNIQLNFTVDFTWISSYLFNRCFTFFYSLSIFFTHVPAYISLHIYNLHSRSCSPSVIHWSVKWLLFPDWLYCFWLQLFSSGLVTSILEDVIALTARYGFSTKRGRWILFSGNTIYGTDVVIISIYAEVGNNIC